MKRLKFEIEKMKVKIEQLCDDALPVTPDLHSSMSDILEEFGPHVENLPETDIKRIFWEQQVHATQYMHTYIHFNMY